MVDNNKSIIELIRYLEKLYGEIAQFIVSFNKLVDEEWEDAKNSSAVTFDLSQTIDNPDRWLTKKIAKYFKNKKNKGEYIGIYIDLNGEDVPVIVAGKLLYTQDNQGEWDIELLWFESGSDENKVDGTPYDIKNEKYNYSGKLFAYPLFDIKNKEDIKSKIYDKIMEL